MLESGCSRRSLLACGLAFAAGAVPPASFAADAPGLVYDVVIVGAGGAGLAAAVSAAQKGASVCVLEKMPAIGGDTLQSAGFMAVVDPRRQSPLGIPDSFSLHVLQTLNAGHDLGDPDLVRQMVEQAPLVADWLERLGVSFEPHIYEAEGTGWRRCIRPNAPRGEGYIRALSHEALRLGVEICTSARALSLRTDMTGVVRGVSVQLGANALPRFVSARNGVILATGGFGASDALVRQWAPEFASLPTDNSPGSTGDGLKMAEALGAAVEGMRNVMCVTGVKSRRNIAVRLASPADFIYVNDSGKRFVEENEAQDTLVTAIRSQHDGRCFVIFASKTESGLDPLTRKSLYRLLVAGDVFSAPSVEKLAAILKLPADNLARSIRRYNEMAAQPGRAGKCLAMPCTMLDSGPYWGYEASLKIHYTAGGLRIDGKGRVLNKKGRPIPGLWAAGGVTGSVHGANCTSGNGLTDAFVMGRIVGEQASAARL
ncbi:MAG: flavocytochrome c [Duodenibacillus sp.]|nr:flavocytochrome c [Duodenibacillus sp.]